MTLNGETMAITLGVVTLAGGLWKIFATLNGMRDELRFEIRNVRESLEKKDLILEALQDKTTLGVTQLREKIDHNTTRLRAELKELTCKFSDIEGFLIKTTEYRARDYGSSQGSK